MLLTTYLFFFLSSLITLGSCLPLNNNENQRQSSSSSSSSSSLSSSPLPSPSPSSTTATPLDHEEDRIQVDLFSQLLSTHWQFDHLDSIMSQSHKEIADHIQNHIEIDIQPSLSSFELSSSPVQQMVLRQQQQQQQQQPSTTVTTTTSTGDHMESDLLKSQMMNAIQARTQGLLPELWDQMGGEATLGRSAIENYVQQLLRTACPLHTDWVAISCLEHHTPELTFQLDTYVQHHLTLLWTRFQQETLPELLTSTISELEKVVDYFNDQAFFSPQHRIIVNALPWSSPPTHLLTMELVSLDDHSLFSNFVTLAKM